VVWLFHGPHFFLALGLLLGCFVAYIAIWRFQPRFVLIHASDGLTGLPNRNAMYRYLKRAIGQAQRSGELVALILIDVDDLKFINDTYGHDRGDAALRAFAARLRGALRAKDFAARNGGDEFALVLKEVPSRAALARILERLQEKTATELPLYHHIKVAVPLSFGAALYPLDALTADDLYVRADRALYAAKRAKANRKHGWVIYDREQDERGKRERLLNLLRNNGLQLHYQPIFRLADKTVCRMEALARLHDHNRSLLMPSQFLPALFPADRLELAIAVVRHVARDLKLWASQGLAGCNVAINVEAHVLVQPEFETRIKSIIADQRIDPSSLSFEITQLDNLWQRQDFANKVRHLSQLGIAFSLDDIGGGDSSLAALRELPIAHIKADQNFISGILRNPSHIDFIIILQALAQMRKVDLVVEGVDDPNVLDALESIDVGFAQGYLLAPPLPGQTLPGWLNQRGRSVQIEAHSRSFSNDLGAETATIAMRGDPDNRRLPKTLFGAYATFLLGNATLMLNPLIAVRIFELDNPHHCIFGRYLDAHNLHETELGKAHKLTHQMRASGQADTPAFRTLLMELHQLVVAEMARTQ
jgi:diguanylate cyclase (GGDEF)-like protein